MKTVRSICLLIFAAIFFVAGCGEEPPPPPKPAPKPVSPTKAASPQTPPVERNKPNVPGVWPFFSGEEESLELAEDILAKNYYLIFDGSGSMAETECSVTRRKIDVAKEAVVRWSASVPQDANLGLYVFHNDTRSVLPLASGPRDAFNRTVQTVNPGGGTPLSETILYAYRELTKQAKRQLGYGEYTVVVVTDGIANDEQRLSKAVDIILANTPITIYSIGFCIGTKHSLNQPGDTVYKSADNPEQLAEGLKDVLAESEFFDEAQFTDK
jgi:hypothetical protein